MDNGNPFLDHGISDVSDAEVGYDSETIETSRTERRGTKRRKLSHSSNSSLEDATEDEQFASLDEQGVSIEHDEADVHNTSSDPADENDQAIECKTGRRPIQHTKSTRTSRKPKTPGVVYLSSLPPYLKPSALRNILAQRGFEPITRLFLTPASKHKHGSKKSSRQLYSEGWLEFASKKTAKRCAEALNAQLVGGPKGGFYYDDLWNMKYLKGMAWDELMAGIREERREEEGRRDEERRKIAQETRAFVDGVEQGKRLDGMKKKRQRQKKDTIDGEEDVQRVWRQHEVAGAQNDKSKGKKVDREVQQVLSKIF